MVTNPDVLREAIRTRYGEIAIRSVDSPSGGCCPNPTADSISTDLYSLEETSGLPQEAVQASLGCGNPTALAALSDGEVVLDLGSGGGIDVLLSARRVGATGFAYGLDMTDEMLALAERNRAAQGANNVRFLKGTIEEIPLPEATVDVVISNCVINLSADKGRVLREAFRVLKPGGRFAVSDVVVQGELPDAIRHDVEAWAGCIAGALEEQEYRDLLTEAGFQDVEVEITRAFDPQESPACGGGAACCGSEEAGTTEREVGGRLVSAFVRARKPGS